MTSLLDDATLRRLRRQTLMYQEVGRTAGDLPAGFHHLQMTRSLGTGREVFEAAASTLTTWRMHEGSGLTVRASSLEACVDAVVVLDIRLGPLKLAAPCRVVYVVDEDHRRGFAYGTLPGHPETGEEAFIVEIADDEEVTATITAFSRPASLLARAAGPLARRIQVRATDAYLDALTNR